MLQCKNCKFPKNYSGNEPSPKGYGYCAGCMKKAGIKKIGRDRHIWVTKMRANGSLYWSRQTLALDTFSSDKRKSKKTKTVRQRTLTVRRAPSISATKVEEYYVMKSENDGKLYCAVSVKGKGGHMNKRWLPLKSKRATNLGCASD